MTHLRDVVGDERIAKHVVKIAVRVHEQFERRVVQHGRHVPQHVRSQPLVRQRVHQHRLARLSVGHYPGVGPAPRPIRLDVRVHLRRNAAFV